MKEYEFIRDLLFTLPLLYAGYVDFKEGRIPNTVIFPCAMFAIFRGIVEGGILGGFSAFRDGVFFALPFYLLYSFNAMGAGDVKFAFVAGAWLGIFQGIYFLLYACIFALAGGFFEILLRGEVFPRLLFVFSLITGRGHPERTFRPVFVPFGGAMSLSVFYIFIERWVLG